MCELLLLGVFLLACKIVKDVSLDEWNRASLPVGMKVGTGKSRTDRHRIPYIPIEYHFYRKIRNSEKIGENPVNSETKSGEAFS